MRGGGVAFYIRSSLKTKLLPSPLGTSPTEALFLQIRTADSNRSDSITLGSVYRPPGTPTSFWETFSNMVDPIVDTSEKIIILGDFNIDVMNKNAPQYAHLQQFCAEHCLKNIVTQPTRSPSGTCLDLALCSETVSGAKHIVLHQDGLSDHHLVLVLIDSSIRLPSRVKRRLRKPNIVKMNAESCNRSLTAAFGQSCFNTPPSPDTADVNLLAGTFTNIALSTLDTHAPLKEITIPSTSKPKPQPWVDDRLRKLLHKRKSFRAVKSKPRAQWSLLNTLTGRNTIQTPPGAGLQSLTDTFTDIVTDPDRPRTLALPPDDDSVSSADPSFTEFGLVTEDYVRDILLKLNVTKAISPVYLRRCGSSLAPPITRIINESLRSGCVPTIYKLATVCPVFKKNDHSEVRRR